MEMNDGGFGVENQKEVCLHITDMYTDSYVYCGYCGKALLKRCHCCDVVNKLDNKYCIECGKQFE